MLKPRKLPWRYDRILIWVAWGGFLWSFTLPAFDSLQASGNPVNTPLTGWQSLSCMLLIFHFAVWLVAPYLLLFVPPIFFGNVVALLVPFVGIRWPTEVAMILFLAGTCGLLLLATNCLGNVYVGYWLWILSLYCMGIILAVSQPED